MRSVYVAAMLNPEHYDLAFLFVYSVENAISSAARRPDSGQLAA
jgi:hypothetical protein